MNASSLPLVRAPGARRLMMFVSAAVLAALCAQVAHADVPGRVGRISFMSGDVQAYSENDPEWKVAYVNQPITSRNSLFVGDSGRAEISIGSTTLAMDAGSQVDIQQLDDNTLNANVVRGRVSMRVRRIDAGDEYHVAVPGADFALLRAGRYRIDALDGSSGITVFDGVANVQNDGGGVNVESGNAMRVVLGQDPNAAPQLQSAAPVSAALDDWLLAREVRFQSPVAQRYVSPNMTGYEDLDANGRWATEQDVGPIWYPTTYVSADWAPYRHGRWAYVQPWGYTWVDDAPWGFAPFHYGRWLQVGGRWGWTPGAYVARPAYAPALVGFYGGAGFNASFRVGAGPAVGWYPLAPWERFSPGYAHNTTYVNHVNNITIVNAPQRFAAGGPGGWNRERGGTVAPQQAFASQRSITQVAIAAPRDLSFRAQSVNVESLPRPNAVPGAVRRGPEPGAGIARPEFRSPRDFANRPDVANRPDRNDAARNGFPRSPSPAGQEPLRPGQPGGPQNDRRFDGPRGQAPLEANRPEGGPGSPQATDRANLQQRQPSQPAFSRERPNGVGSPPAYQPSQAPGQRVGEPQMNGNRDSDRDRDPNRFAPRAPVPRGNEDGAQDRARIGGERPFESRNDQRGDPRSAPQVNRPQQQLQLQQPQQPFQPQQQPFQPQQRPPPMERPAAVFAQPAPGVERTVERSRPEPRQPPQPPQAVPQAPQPTRNVPQPPQQQQPQAPRIERPAPPAAPVAPAAPAQRPAPRNEPGDHNDRNPQGRDR